MGKKINLICLPFAGGSKYSYRALFDNNDVIFNAVTLEYPGHGSRVVDELVPDIKILVDDLYKQVETIVQDGEYAIYGHSLGGLLGYLLTVKILLNKHKGPKHLLVSGAAGPSALSRTERRIHLHPHKEFLDEVIALGGMPEEIAREADMLNFLEPILRNDFKVSATYVHQEHEPLDIPMTIVSGTEESITENDLLLWQKECTKTIEFIKMPGDHFFIFKHKAELVDIISKKLQSLEFSSYERSIIS